MNKGKKTATKPLNDNQCSAILNRIRKSRSKMKMRNATMFIIELSIGLRVHDLVRLQKQSVFDDNGNVKDRVAYQDSDGVTEHKTHKVNKLLYLSQTAQNQLWKYHNWLNRHYPDSKWLFPNNRPVAKKHQTGYLKERDWYKIITRVAKKLHYNHVGTHSLRKTFGLRYYHLCGNDISKITQRFQHTNPAITERYLGIRDKTLQQQSKEIMKRM